jgi:hypothetical protein
MTVLRKCIQAGAIFVLLTGGAAAQSQKPGSIYGAANQGQSSGPSPFAPTKKELEERKAVDQDYQAAIKSAPSAAKGSADPWGDVRAGGPAAPKAK